MTKPNSNLANKDKEQIKRELNAIRHPFDIAVYSIENYFNMGAIFRIGHNFLCSKFWMVDFEKFYKKATMGTHKYENIEKLSLSEFLEKSKDRSIIVFERRPNIPAEEIYYYRYPENPILFFGSEKFGVPDEVLDRAHNIVTIPVYGIHNDLNVAVSVGIAVYDWHIKRELF